MRRYDLRLHGSREGFIEHLFYCPWCGKKLPKKLNSKWDEILEKEYGITDPFFNEKDKAKMPKEFWTDEWWKKRGL